MEEQRWYLTLSGELLGNINAHYAPAVTAFAQEYDVQGLDIWAVQLARSEEPKPYTPDVVLERSPYSSRDIILERMAESVDRGVLDQVSLEVYTLSDKGRALAEAIPVAVVETAAAMQPIPQDQSERLASLLRQVVDDCLAVPEPNKPCLRRSRTYDMGPDTPVVERIRRYLGDLAAFRDDVHIAAWRAYGVSGIEWDAFSHVQGQYVFGDPAVTAVDLAEKLGGFYGYDSAAYEQALQAVVGRGWLVAENGRYRTTPEGERVRQGIEAETDRLYFSPWSLSQAELDEMQSLMTQMRDALQPSEENES